PLLLQPPPSRVRAKTVRNQLPASEAVLQRVRGISAFSLVIHAGWQLLQLARHAGPVRQQAASFMARPAKSWCQACGSDGFKHPGKMPADVRVAHAGLTMKFC